MKRLDLVRMQTVNSWYMLQEYFLSAYRAMFFESGVIVVLFTEREDKKKIN